MIGGSIDAPLNPVTERTWSAMCRNWSHVRVFKLNAPITAYFFTQITTNLRNLRQLSVALNQWEAQDLSQIRFNCERLESLELDSEYASSTVFIVQALIESQGLRENLRELTFGSKFYYLPQHLDMILQNFPNLRSISINGATNFYPESLDIALNQTILPPHQIEQLTLFPETSLSIVALKQLAITWPRIR